MKKTHYMARNEMNEFMWLSATRQIFEKILFTTAEKSWRQRLKTCDTLVKRIIDERSECFDELEKIKAKRRIDNTAIKVYSYDDARVDRDDVGRKITISQDDFLDLLDAAFLQCYTCPQGGVVKECPRRKMYHRLGLQVHALRENPAIGECEFRGGNEQRAVTPQYKMAECELIEQMP